MQSQVQTGVVVYKVLEVIAALTRWRLSAVQPQPEAKLKCVPSSTIHGAQLFENSVELAAHAWVVLVPFGICKRGADAFDELFGVGDFVCTKF